MTTQSKTAGFGDATPGFMGAARPAIDPRRKSALARAKASAASTPALAVEPTPAHSVFAAQPKHGGGRRKIGGSKAAVGDLDHQAADDHGPLVEVATPSPDQNPRKAMGKMLREQARADYDLPGRIKEIKLRYRDKVNLTRQKVAADLRASNACTEVASLILTNGDKWEPEEGAKLLAKIRSGKPMTNYETVMTASAVALLRTSDELSKDIDVYDGVLEILAKGLPGCAYVESTPGFGLVTFACIVACAGDLGIYTNPAKLWRQMGIGINLDGTRQRKVKGAMADEQKYAPQRRSLLWNMGQPILVSLGANIKNNRENALRHKYDEWKPGELAKCEAIAADPVLLEKWSMTRRKPRRPGETDDTEVGQKFYAPAQHAHNRTLRRVEKYALKMVWRAWRKEVGLPYQDPVYDTQEMAA